MSPPIPPHLSFTLNNHRHHAPVLEHCSQPQGWLVGSRNGYRRGTAEPSPPTIEDVHVHGISVIRRATAGRSTREEHPLAVLIVWEHRRPVVLPDYGPGDDVRVYRAAKHPKLYPQRRPPAGRGGLRRCWWWWEWRRELRRRARSEGGPAAVFSALIFCCCRGQHSF